MPGESRSSGSRATQAGLIAGALALAVMAGWYGHRYYEATRSPVAGGALVRVVPATGESDVRRDHWKRSDLPAWTSGPSDPKAVVVAPAVEASPAPVPPPAPRPVPPAPVVRRYWAADPLPLPDPVVPIDVARSALPFVGADPEADSIWFAAINDPALSPEERSNLIEDLNESGFANPDAITPEELPLVLNRLEIIEALAPDAMDDTNAAAFAEAYKDLSVIAERLTQ